MLVPSPAVQGVVDAAAALAGDCASEHPDVVAMSNVEALLTARSQLDAQIAQELAVIDARSATVEECGRHTRAWLVEEQMLDGGAAARKTRIARQLWRWPTTVAAWQAGEISEDHVAVIFKALATVPADVVEIVEKALLEIARDCPPRDVAAAVDQILVACGVEDAEAAAARRYGTRGVTVAKTFGGTGSLAGTLSPILTDKILRALEHAGRPAGEDDDRTRAQRMHDGLESIVDHYLDSPNLPGQDKGERPARVIVTIGLEDLERRLGDGFGLLPTGARISAEAARRLACDAEVIPSVLDGPNVLDLGHGRRTFSADIRRAAIIRDGDRCVFPNCREPRYEAHHWLVHWADGGNSDLDNCAWLRLFHHYLVHEGGWKMCRETDGGYTFRSPAGKIQTPSTLVNPNAAWEPPDRE